MKTSKSHTKAEIWQALLDGEEIWEFDSGNDGEDDILIGSQKEVEIDLCRYFEIDALRSDWTLARLTPEEVREWVLGEKGERSEDENMDYSVAVGLSRPVRNISAG